MTENKERERLLRVKQKIAAHRPKFVRPESWRYKRLKPNWRRPKGIDNKMRRKVKGYPKMAGVGYRGPKAVRGMHPSGYLVNYISNPEQLEGLDKDKDAIIIQRTVGSRKRKIILDRAEELQIRVLNMPVKAVEIGEAFEEAEEYELLEDEDFEFEDDFELDEENETEKSEGAVEKEDSENESSE